MVTHTIDNPNKKEKIILDTKNLVIHDVRINDDEKASFSFGEKDELLGLPLIIQINIYWNYDILINVIDLHIIIMSVCSDWSRCH